MQGRKELAVSLDCPLDLDLFNESRQTILIAFFEVFAKSRPFLPKYTSKCGLMGP